MIALSVPHDLQLATMLLTHWQEVDKDRVDLPTGTLSVEAKVFKTNPNSRDLKVSECLKQVACLTHAVAS